MKEYNLTKEELIGIKIKKIHYEFKVEDIHPIKKIQNIILHQTGNSNTIQKVINNHVKKRHFSSIGYHILIGKNGQYYLSRELNKTGAHCFGYNNNSVGIGLFGNFDKNEPTEKQINSLKILVESLKKKYKITSILGHNQAIYNLLKKKCPKIPSKKLFDIKTDIEYYSFLKKVKEIIDKENNEEIENLFNRLKTCPGVNSYPHLKDIISN